MAKGQSTIFRENRIQPSLISLAMVVRLHPLEPLLK